MTIDKQVTFTAANQTFTMVMNFSALCEVERELNDSFPRIVASIQSGEVRLLTIVALFRAALLKERPGITNEETMALIEEIGPEQAAKLIADAIDNSPMFKAGAAKQIKRKAA